MLWRKQILKVMVHGRSYRELVSDKSLGAYDETQAIECYEAAKKEANFASLGELKILVNAETVDSSYLHILTRKWQDIFGFYIGIEDVSASEFNNRIAQGDYTISLYPLKGDTAMGSAIIEKREKSVKKRLITVFSICFAASGLLQ